MSRELKAILLAPLPVVVPLLLLIGINALAGGTGDAGGSGIALATVTLVVLSYGATFFIGIPIHLILRHFEKTALIYYLGLTVLPFVLLAGTIAVLCWLAPAPVPPTNPFGLQTQEGLVIKATLAIAAIAALSASVFWYFGVRQPKS